MIVNGTSSRDVIGIVASGSTAVVNGLAAQVRIDHPESANDLLSVNGLGGNDSFSIGSACTVADRRHGQPWPAETGLTQGTAGR